MAFFLVGGGGALAYIFATAHKPAVTTVTRSSAPVPTPERAVRLALVATGLPSPTDIVSTGLKSDDRLFVLDQAGVIRILDQIGAVMPTPFLDITSKVLRDSEMGLLGMAFSPHYATDGYFYLDYIDRAQNTVVARYHVSADSNRADPASEQIILRTHQPYSNHKGGDLLLGPKDGDLYITLGDGGSQGDPDNRGQSMNTWLGKILRIDVSTLPYKVPKDNPFVGQTGKLPEIWDLGLRNPWRISFDSATNDLMIADVGQNQHEELDVEAPDKGGNNYGWRCYEGDHDYVLAGCSARSGYVFPQLEYDHTGGRCSITGGFVYRGSQYPSLSGKYIYADYCTGEVFVATKNGSTWSAKLALTSPYKVTTFGVDSHGEVYLADQATGSVYKVEDAGR